VGGHGDRRPVLLAGANGSLIHRGDRLVGSELIGQPFDGPQYFWLRPSAISPAAIRRPQLGGSNLGPTNSAQFDAVRARIELLRAADPGNTLPIPVDLVTASGSGLDPEISPRRRNINCTGSPVHVESIRRSYASRSCAIRALASGESSASPASTC